VVEGFVSLAAFLRGGVAAENAEPTRTPVVADPQQPVESAAPCDAYAHATTIRELTLLRLAAFEAFERAATALLATFASDVLGRELALAPVDVEALARAAIASYGEAEPVTIVLCASDAERVSTELPVRVDPSLAAGDLIVEVRDGALESQLSFRLAAAVERAATVAP
jgi:flagellar biosynthesis/type III secretory pathway protein FliH